MSIDNKLQELGITLPEAAAPAGAYVPTVATGDLIFVSGQLPIKDGKITYTDKVGDNGSVTTEQAQEAAKLCAINGLAALKAHLGTLDNIKQIVRIEVYVNSSQGFTDQALVANGASNFLKEVFGDAGLHTRLALGLAELPLNAAVELGMIVEKQS